MTPERLVGLGELSAELVCCHYNMTMRIVQIDDKYLPCTQDYRLDRINVCITDGVVTEAYIG